MVLMLTVAVNRRAQACFTDGAKWKCLHPVVGAAEGGEAALEGCIWQGPSAWKWATSGGKPVWPSCSRGLPVTCAMEPEQLDAR